MPFVCVLALVARICRRIHVMQAALRGHLTGDIASESRLVLWAIVTVLLGGAMEVQAGIAQAAGPASRIVVSMHPLARTVLEAAPRASVEVETLLPQGATPHDASLTPRQVEALVKADLVVWWGPEVEPYLVNWLKKRSGETLDLSQLGGLVTLPPRMGDAHDHHLAPSRYDIHVWWSSQNLILAADAVARWLAAHRTDERDQIETSLASFTKTMRGVAGEGRSLWQASPRFAVFHDGWQYLEHDIGIASNAQFMLDHEIGAGLGHLAGLRKQLQQNPVDCLLLEPGMNTSLADKLMPSTPRVMIDPMGWDATEAGASGMLRSAYRRIQQCTKH